MPQFKVRVKWGKQKFDDVDLDTDEIPEVFKMQLFSLTGVAPDRQKVMIAGVVIQNDDWGKAKSKIKQNSTLLLMGSVDELPTAPVEKTKFIEDMTEEDAAAAMSVPCGLENFGNTCYMNATIQCLKVVPELKDTLTQYVSTASSSSVPESITSALKLLYDMMAKNQPRMPLLLFMNSLHKAMPHFAERDQKTGTFKQQDAHECWSTVLTNLGTTLTFSETEATASAQLKFIEQYFGVRQESVYKCIESSEEPVTTETEKNLQVSCFISQDVRYIHTALKKGLEGEIEKNSPVLGRDALYKKTTSFSRLPAYLTVQLVRFFVGKAPNSDEIVSKKILKDVKFQMKLDMYDFCTPELQEKLMPNRRKFKEVEDKKTALKAKAISEFKMSKPTSKAEPMETSKSVEYEPYAFPDDPGSSNSGLYELQAVLTHQGRSSSSGHYLAWVRHSGNVWLKLDDDKVTMVLEEDILKLSGGGDWHVAYILLYGPQRLEKLSEEDPPTEPMVTEPSTADSASPQDAATF